MWLDIRIRLCGWTKSLLVSRIGVCVTLSIRSSDLVILELPVLKRQSLGHGDPKLSLLRLWGQSSCFFNFRTIRSSSVLKELSSSTPLYATKSSPKDASSLVSLAGDTVRIELKHSKFLFK